MAGTQTQTALVDQILHPQNLPTPKFTFDSYLRQTIPALGVPSKVTRPVCQDFKSGHCPRGANCPDRHFIPESDRSGIGNLICKHYQKGLCKKGDQCDYAHTFNLREERPCKDFSRFGICQNGEDCTYLHIAPTSDLRRPACPHYTRGFCALGPYCALRHIKHDRICPYFLAGFCPNGRNHPPDADKVVSCQFGAHARWIKDEEIHPKKPEPRKLRDPDEERREQEEREDEYFAEKQREYDARAEAGGGRWAGRGRRGARNYKARRT